MALYWTYDNVNNLMKVSSVAIGPGPFSLFYNDPQTYYSDKTYQYIIETENVYTDSTNLDFSVTPYLWTDELEYKPTSGNTPGTTPSNSAYAGEQYYIHYSKPTNTVSGNRSVKISANSSLKGTKGIRSFKLNELNFNILGYSYYRTKLKSININSNGNFDLNLKNSLGWYYDKDNNLYHWFDYVNGNHTTGTDAKKRGMFPVGGTLNNKESNISYRLNNALWKFISYTTFNLSFFYKNNGDDFPLKIYLTNEEPKLNYENNDWNKSTYIPKGDAILVAEIPKSYSPINGTSVKMDFYGLAGNQYLLFVGGFAGVSGSAKKASMYVKDIEITGGYHPVNNTQINMTGGLPSIPTFPITNATYSYMVGYGNTFNDTQSLINGVSVLNSKIGNGTFRAGIWENGVWNSGWRVDQGKYEFYDIGNKISYNKNKRWRVEIIGPTSSVSNFNTGDKVAIGNIVAIDINENRNLLKNYLRIISKTDNSIVVEFDNDFPLRRIERDSEFHRIYVTRNVWLSGAFLNGYFNGVWNNGLFKGYPLLTKMEDTQWIDGTFDGGHFQSKDYTIPNFIDTYYTSGKVGLTFSSPHGLTIGDIIIVDKLDKNVNINYDGEHEVIDIINDNHIVIDVEWGENTTNEEGSIKLRKSTGLIQKMIFKSNNISKITSVESMEANAVFLYNSWMDIIYDNEYATNILKPMSYINSTFGNKYSENNLYGYITRDILESVSYFRDSFSLKERRYSLGTKYKIFFDYIGDAGLFEDDFGTETQGISQSIISNSDATIVDFGFTYSASIDLDINVFSGAFAMTSSIPDIKFSRVIGSDTSSGDELLVNSTGHGGILNVTTDTKDFVINKTYDNIKKNRYTFIEFDLNSYDNLQSSLTYEFKTDFASIQVPYINFDNVNIVKRSTRVSNVTSSDILVKATYLPIHENVNLLKTSKNRKIEYFFNKTDLNMIFYGSNVFTYIESEYVLDNLHFYEVDMIPFFQYLTEENVNKGVVVPFQGISPTINYEDNTFSFIDSLVIGLDSIYVENTYNVLIPTFGNITGSGGGRVIYDPVVNDSFFNPYFNPGGG